ncbi:FGGY-family carbohydrate kinase [Pelagibius sp. Alg239-R121]|uniref:FGGY-family carbohydrate kinase n=1 Tax=Pelagibius sp. Alg239-R121 TaxID=2993448 RepID=UPI0024A671A2|nr:FGGY-family carbohydrate kinase [Pelagibius sp. Alg239-R121]
MKDVLIGIDAGTSVIKAIAFSTGGEQLAVYACTNSYENLRDGGVEQDIGRTWRDAAKSICGLAEQLPGLAERTVGVAVTGQGDGTWLIDAVGEPVGPAWVWLDARAAEIVHEMRASPDDRARFEITGTGLAACQQGPQLQWMKRHQPEVLAKAATAFHCKDWLYYKFCGDRVTDPSEGTFTYGDFRKRNYSDDVVASLGLIDHIHLLPEIIEGTSQHGSLTAEAAGDTGLLEGTPVVLGYVDVICAALGAGLYEPGVDLGCTIVGSTGMHMRFVKSANEVVLNPHSTGYTMPFPVPGSYAQMQSNLAGTLNIDWLLDVALGVLSSEGVERSRADLLSKADDLVAAAQPANLLYQPYISEAGERGPFTDATASAAFLGLSTRHGYGDFLRATYEGLSFAARDCYGAMGPLPNEVRLTGGAARSRQIRHILSAALNSGVRTSGREEAGAAGVAMMAAVCLGVYPDMAACAAKWVSPYLGEVEDPDPDLAEIYQATFAVYEEARRNLPPLWRSLTQRNGADHGQ